MPRLLSLSALRGLYQSTQRVRAIPSPASTFPVLNNFYSTDPPDEHHPPSQEPWIPEYIEKFEEPIDEKRSRLMYQSRKRGMLENGLLLGSFAKKYLAEMDEEKLTLYDRLINLPSNDWEIYYWAVEQQPTPEDFDNVVMDMLKEHAKNKDRESRIRMPELT